MEPGDLLFEPVPTSEGDLVMIQRRCGSRSGSITVPQVMCVCWSNATAFLLEIACLAALNMMLHKEINPGLDGGLKKKS